MKSKLFRTFMTVFVATSLSGCFPDGPDFVDEFDVVYTNYDETFNFGGKMKYAMPDSVVEITGAATTGEPVEFMNPGSAKIILDRIKSNMYNRGYQLTSRDSADFILLPSTLEVTNIVYYYDYWSYYYGWYYPPGYGGWYYPYAMVSSYTTGSLIMPLIDNRATNPSGKSKVAWVGVVNGVLEGGSVDFTGRINKSIDQAFTQSPYLHP